MKTLFKIFTNNNLHIISSSHYLIITSLLLSAFYMLPFNSAAQKPSSGYPTKVFTKNFTVSAKDQLEVNTRFTDVVFQEWDKNEIEFNTTVTFKKATENDLENVLDDIKITNKQSGKKVSYTLTYNKSNTKGNDISNKLKISLLIKIPKDIFLNITSSFGNFELENVFNNFNAEITFGNLTVENFAGEKNTVNISHGNLKVGQANQLTLNVQFSDESTITEINTLKLKSDFSTIKMDKAKVIDVQSSHGNISILNSIDKIEGTMSFGTLKINTLKNSCIFTNFSFSNIKIHEVLPSFTHITVVSSHSTVVLNVPQNQSFAFDYSGSFTNFKDQNIKLNDATFKAANKNSVQMKGIYGKNPNPDKSVKIQASFGTVSLFGK